VKVILRQSVKKLGNKGELVEVSEGYARNYLIPRGLAVEANDANLRSLSHEQSVAKQREAREREEAKAKAAKLESLTVEMRARAGESGRLFGSITAGDIADAVKAASGIEIDKRKLELKEPIKSLGVYRVPVHLHQGITAELKVQVVDGDRA